MTVLLANPILWLFYIAAAALGILTGVKKLPAFFGLVNLAVHAAAMIAIFFAGGALEDRPVFFLATLLSNVIQFSDPGNQNRKPYVLSLRYPAPPCALPLTGQSRQESLRMLYRR